MEQQTNYDFPFSNTLDSNSNPPLNLVMCRIIPNSQLGPEKTNNFELGYRQGMGPLTLDLTLYRMKISDQITQVVTGIQNQTIQIPTGLPSPYPAYVPETVPIYINQFQNRGNATNTGIEAALTWAVQKNWTAGLNGRYLHYTQDDSSNGAAALHGEFSYAPKHTVTAWTRFSHGPWSGYLDVQHVGATQVEALMATGINAIEDRPAYFQGDVQGQFEIVKGLKLGVYARNAARPFTAQGASGPERPPVYQFQRRELGASLTYRF